MAASFLAASILVAVGAALGSFLSSYPGEDVKLNKFIVTYSLIPDPHHKFSFFSMPRTTAEAKQDGFAQAGDRQQVDHTTIWCRDTDYRVCVLFDLKGSVAGLQVSRSVEETKADTKLPVDFDKIPQWFRQTLLGVEVHSTIAYFVDESILAAGGRDLTQDTPTAPNGIRLLVNNSEKTLDVPHNERDLKDNEIGFTKQNCFIGMGQHHFQIGPDSTCAESRPYFGLYSKRTRQLLGFGVAQFGKISVGRDGKNGWFEKPTATIVSMIAPHHPACLTDWINQYGLNTLHVYFVEKPWRTTCW